MAALIPGEGLPGDWEGQDQGERASQGPARESCGGGNSGLQLARRGGLRRFTEKENTVCVRSGILNKQEGQPQCENRRERP